MGKRLVLYLQRSRQRIRNNWEFPFFDHLVLVAKVSGGPGRPVGASCFLKNFKKLDVETGLLQRSIRAWFISSLRATLAMVWSESITRRGGVHLALGRETNCVCGRVDADLLGR